MLIIINDRKKAFNHSKRLLQQHHPKVSKVNLCLALAISITKCFQLNLNLKLIMKHNKTQ